MLIAQRIVFRKILKEISISLPAGEVLAVLGPNGAGKSTLLKALSGEWLPSEGEVILNGQSLRQWKEEERARVLAVLPQFSLLSAPFTAREVVLMGRMPHHSRKESQHDHSVAQAALEKVEIAHLADAIYTQLSGGEQQSVQMARVLAQIWDEPPLGSRFLLLDEPTANLDLAQGHRILSLARQFARQGVGVMVILHDLNLASQYADRIVLLKEGMLIAEGPPASVLNAAHIECVFECAVTILEHQGKPLVVANTSAHKAH